MTPTTTANTYPEVVPGATRVRKIRNLANQPAMGGMPASEARKTSMATARPGAYSNRPEKLVSSAEWVLRATAITTAKAPRFMTT